MTEKRCDYGYVNGLRVPSDAIRVEVIRDGRTVDLRLVNARLHAAGPDSITDRELAALVAEGARPTAILDTPRGPVRGLVIDPAAVFSGRSTSPFDPGNREALEALSPEDRRNLAMLALSGLSYGENDTASHARRLAWVVENMSPAEIARWCASLPTGQEIENGAGNLLLNVGYLMRHDRPAVERLVAASPELAYELYRLFPGMLAELMLEGLTHRERSDLGMLLTSALIDAGDSEEALTSLASHAIGTGIERARAADPANRPLPPDPFTGNAAPIRPARVPDTVVNTMAVAATRGEFVTGVVSDDGSESAVFTAALAHIEPEQGMRMMYALQDVLRELDRLDVVNMIPAASGIPGGVFHVDAQRLSPQEYDRVLEAMREFFLSLDPESAPARTRGFASLMGPRPVELAPSSSPTVSMVPPSPPASGTSEESVPSSAPTASAVLPSSAVSGTSEESAPARPVVGRESHAPDGVAAARSTLVEMRARAERGIAVSRRRGAEKESSVYDGDLLDELLDLRTRAVGLPAVFVSALDDALATVGRRPGVVLAQEVLDMTSKLTSILPPS